MKTFLEVCLIIILISSIINLVFFCMTPIRKKSEGNRLFASSGASCTWGPAPLEFRGFRIDAAGNVFSPDGKKLASGPPVVFQGEMLPHFLSGAWAWQNEDAMHELALRWLTRNESVPMPHSEFGTINMPGIDPPVKP
jgi:hypothetical protein